MSNNEEAVQIILDRMRTNPEEFYNHSSSRWRWLFNGSHKEILSEEERKRLQDGLDVVRRHEFKTRVLSTLLNEEPQQNSLYGDSFIIGTGATGQSFSQDVFPGVLTANTRASNTSK